MAPKDPTKGSKGPSGVRQTPQPEAAAAEAEDDQLDQDFDMPTVIKVKPDDQLELTPDELEKEVPPRVLYPANPRAPTNITQFSFKERAFKTDDQVDQAVFHFSMDGAILKKDGAEAEKQFEVQAGKEEKQAQRDEEEAVEEDFDPPEDAKEMPVKNPLRNQFNFSERAAQTKNPMLRERGWSTEPPPTTEFKATVTQWEIYDQYIRDIEAAKEKDKEDKKSKQNYDDDGEKKKKSDADPTYSENMKLSIKIMERMVNQNAENEVYRDFKYWEDRSDEFRDGEGSLLPLWRFSSEKAKKKQVTCIKWNPRYNDLCAVGFGSYEFLRQGTGVICCYSLKNTRFPEYVFNTDAGVCCLDWHPSHPAVLAVGLYDGTVLVYDVRARTKKPIYQSTVRTNKHTDPVWEVRWNNDESSGTLNFFSISSDGRVSNWFLMKNRLESEEVMELKLMSGQAGSSEDDETSLAGLAGGLCFDFHRKSEHLFLVGTEEGRIHKCSKAFSGQYLETYEGHTMAVYAVRWNPQHKQIFISASADWTVKMWDHSVRTPVMSFDLGQAIGDVAWAPYSSTTFAAITSDGGATSGVVKLYDLSVDRNEPLCTQKVVKAKAKLTHVAFNSTEPIVIVGDDRGGVNTLKLSPNLRKGVEHETTEDGTIIDPSKTDDDLQIEKMEKLLEMVTETKEPN
jgi:dynein intermediate chain 1